ncbi:DUF4142 domain-containing protein [Allosphingosinicella flava]|uniref:DUF4142 domain-containing protein n=1 Tax=Allosphingosinicella flava TaxID=2771430 RepID=A0A7T2GIF4_9SPHN|nr:DUF4142 domain-containing protein [Sphingosinicella flava]QPQ54123.1 DUF4142 domain-containing protein [Sphingosinicella flava]
MKIRILAATAALCALAACGDNETPAANDMAMNDAMMANDMAMNDMAMDNMMMNGSAAAVPANGQDYAAMAAASDMFEIESSRLAQEKAQNADVKSFAAMLVTDHQKSTADLKTAAGQAQPAITVTPQMNAEQTANLEALRGASGAEFDRLYLQQQVPAHEKALAMLQGYAASGDVPSLKQHASATTGPVEKHLARARELMGSMGQ